MILEVNTWARGWRCRARWQFPLVPTRVVIRLPLSYPRTPHCPAPRCPASFCHAVSCPPLPSLALPCLPLPCPASSCPSLPCPVLPSLAPPYVLRLNAFLVPAAQPRETSPISPRPFESISKSACGDRTIYLVLVFGCFKIR